MMRTLSSPGADVHDDDGFTLVEVLVGMVILTIFMGIFTGAMVSTFHSVYRTQQTADAQQNLNVAFTRLDREVRYADGISNVSQNDAASQPTGSYTVMFSDSSSGTQVCTQLRYTPNGTLSQRSWTQTQDVNGNDQWISWLDKGSPLATDLNVDPLQTAAADTTDQTVTGAPFAAFPAGGNQNNQRLELSFTARDSSRVTGSNTRARHFDVTFAALNTNLTTSSPTVCKLGLNNSSATVSGTVWTWPTTVTN